MRIGSREGALLGVVGVLALAAAFYIVLLKPERRSAARLQTEITVARASLASAEHEEAVAHSTVVYLTRTRAESVTAQHAVPRLSNIPAFIKLLQRSANGARVGYYNITVGSAGGGSATSSASASTRDEGATTVPVSLTFNGGYQALNRLVRRLDSYVVLSRGRLRASGPLVGIGAVSVNPKNGSGGHNPELSITLTTTIYQHAPASTVLGAGAGGS